MAFAASEGAHETRARHALEGSGNLLDFRTASHVVLSLPTVNLPIRVLCLFVVAACLTLAQPAHATTFELGGEFGADFNAGASTLLTLHYSDGTEQDIKAGSGLRLAAGAGAMFFDQQPHRLETQLTLGIKYSTMQPTTNASLDFIRVPIELLAFYRNEDWHFRVGGGGAWYVSNSLSGGGALNGEAHFDPALGAVMQADFVWGAFALGLRYTVLRLHAKEADVSANANSLGLNLSYFYRLESSGPQHH
jgi:hypothetical protein